ncbi:MAG: sirohydrochlorin cobaltochelatase [Firmicutes bacterium]|nr:sirohydrochlorin cobaltochelatase [Bacillota bacterium]
MERCISHKGLLVVSFGASCRGENPNTLETVEAALGGAFPDRRFFRAWTSGMLRRKLEREQGRQVDAVDEALQRMSAAGITDVLVQPTHLLMGEEFRSLEETIRSFAGQFASLAMGLPLLAQEADAAALAKIIEKVYPTGRGELLALMGHGSAALDFPAYEILERQFRQDGYDNICIGTVEFTPGIEPVLARIRRERPRRVHLAPLLLAAGGHVMKDMAGDDAASWKNQIAGAGAEAVCHLIGLGDYAAVRDMYIQHARCASSVKWEKTL